MLTPREKSPLPEAQRRVEPATLHHAGQRDQDSLTELFLPLFFTDIQLFVDDCKVSLYVLTIMSIEK